MNKLLLAIIAIAAMVGCTPKPQSISGKLENLNEGEVILEKFNRKGNEEIAKMNAAGGEFSFEYSPEQTDLYFIKTEKATIPVFLDKNSVVISGDLDKQDELVIKGSIANDQFKASNDTMKAYGEKEQKIVEAYRAAASAQDQINMASQYQAYEMLQDEKNTAILQQLKANPASEVTAFLAQMTFGHLSDPVKVKEIIDIMDISLTGYSYYDALVDRYNKLENVAVGQIAPDFELSDPDGNLVKLSSLRGKYILMDFWASWCGPCRKENPNVVALYKQYNNKNFDIIGISLDKDKDKWLEAIEADGLAWNHVSDLKYWDSMAADLYAVSGIPHTILLDPAGKIIAKDLRGDALAAKLAEVLN